MAQLRGDKAAASVAFSNARAEGAKLVAEQPDYAEGLCVLGMADAALGHKDEAIREGRRAVELMPVSKRCYKRPVVDPIPGCYLCVDRREGSRLGTVKRCSTYSESFELWSFAFAPLLGPTAR